MHRWFTCFFTYYFRKIYINPNWIMQIERADIDGFSNKVYIYLNYDVVIEYYPSELYRKTKVKLDEEIKDFIEKLNCYMEQIK